VENDGVLNSGSVISGIGVFVSMLVLGIVLGIFFGALFSKLLGYAKNENLQITLSLLVAHFTFIVSEIINEH